MNHLVLAAALVLVASNFARADPPDFVRVDGTRFVVDGKPFSFVGANLAAMHGGPSRAMYKETLGALASDGLRVGRIWAFGEGPRDAIAWFRENELFRVGADEFLENAYVQLDKVVAEASARGVRLIVTLSNNWSDYGGIPMYLRWAGLPAGEDSDDPVREAFYSDDKVRSAFRAGLVQLVGRTNTVSGLRYADDPTIFSWELMNESTVVTPAGAAARRAWIAEMARLIKSIDSHHLVGAGLYGYGSREDRAEWIRVHRIAEIDYCDSHLYPEGADLVVAGGGETSASKTRVRGRAERRLEAFLDDRAQLARFVIGKPLVIGEFGFRTDRPGGAASGFLGGERAAWFRRLLEHAFVDGVAGALAWIYQPWSGAPRDFGIYVDRPDTDDVRAVLRTWSATFARGPSPENAPKNARLSTAAGDRFMYDPLSTTRGQFAPHRRWIATTHGARLHIAPARFATAVFEKVGATDGKSQVWGVGWGRFRYRYVAPGGVIPRRIRIEARLSAEWPGAHGPVGGTSRVRLRIDGHRVAERTVVTDDGVGRRESFVITDAALLGRLAAGTHTLDFAVPDSPRAHGLCIYGRVHSRRGLAPRATPIRISYEGGEGHSDERRVTSRR